MTDLHSQFGSIDIHLFDQLLQDRIPAGASILDAGCGGGRNLVYFLRGDYRVRGADVDEAAVSAVRRLAQRLAPDTPGDAFRREPVEAMTFEDASADVVISSAVLHFAADEEEFWAMLRGSWRPLKPGGLFFCRTAGMTGMEGQARPLGGRRYTLPDGSDRFLVDEAMLLQATRTLGGELLDPIKTTVVHGRRSMMTWVLRRASC
jgi:SAM-dependent methyltransferase